MASHREMKALAEDLGRVRSTASMLLALAEADPLLAWSDWELDFLEHMTRYAGEEPLSQRQREKLVELRDSAQSYATFDGLSIKSLVEKCWLARIDLSEEDEAFIDRLKQAATTVLKRGPALRLLRCARDLGLIDRFVDIDAGAQR